MVIKLTDYQKNQQPADRLSISDLIPSLIPRSKLNNWPSLVPYQVQCSIKVNVLFLKIKGVLGFKTFYKGSVQVMVKV